MLATRIIVAAASLLALGRKGVRELRLGAARAPIAVAPPAEARRLTLADQWGRVAGIISTASEKAAEAGRCQAAAALQLDLAHYGLTSLVAELAAVMDVGARPMSASVHVLKLGKSHKVEGTLAA